MLGNPYGARDSPSKENDDQRCELATNKPYECEEGQFLEVAPSTADQLKVCARQSTIADGLMNFDPVTGEDVVRKGLSELVVCPNGREAFLVEDAISFADTKVVFVRWKVGKLLRKAQRRWMCGARWVESDMRWLGAMKCDFRLRLVRARSGVSTNTYWEVNRYYRNRMRMRGEWCGRRLRLATTDARAKKHHFFQVVRR